ncbi:hypothetical protein G6F65_023120 [Rhizopus arrhizus]|nr:hypothetical protein G6F65_023120 [Rhizopus arrhizus]
MIGVGAAAAALVQGVGKDAALRRTCGRRDHQLAFPALQLVVHGAKAHAGLQHAIAQRLVDLQDAVHAAAQVHDHLAGTDGRARAQPDVLAIADGIELDAEAIGQTH